MTEEHVQLTLEDQATQAAIDQVEEHAEAEWKKAALEAIRATAQQLDEFIIDDVWRFMPAGFHTHDLRAMGAMILIAKAKRIIASTGGYRTSRVPGHHGNPRTVWRSLLRGEPLGGER